MSQYVQKYHTASQGVKNVNKSVTKTMSRNVTKYFTTSQLSIKTISFIRSNSNEPKFDQASQQAQADPRTRTGYYDYNQNKFVLPNGKPVTVVVNEGNRARGKRSFFY